MKKVRFCKKCHLPVHKGDCYDVEERTSDYICSTCGNKYLTDEQKKRKIIVTVHDDYCGLCGKFGPVINIRYYNWLEHPDYIKSRKLMHDKRIKYRKQYEKNKSKSKI